ncbi:MAG TPA: stress response translation initiation inhibitor YciH [Nitrososphaeraceae archaeon]|jgi:translation initiation factor 1
MLEEDNSNSLSINSIVHQLDLEKTEIIISKEIKKFNKLTTLIRGINNSKEAQLIIKDLKSKLGTGGTIKDGQIILQGDHRETVKKLLVARGFKQESIEII